MRGPKYITDPFKCTLGVRQGDSLSPFLFSLYVNNLEYFLRNINGSTSIDIDFMKLFVLLYSDDGVLLAETSTGLQSGLDILYRYCTRWKLTLNVTKTKILFFRARGNEFLMINGIIMGMSSKLLIFFRTLVWYFLTQVHSQKHS